MTIGSILILRKMMESTSSCDLSTISGPTPQDKRPIGSARNIQNLRKMSRKRKKLPLQEGLGGYFKKVYGDVNLIKGLSKEYPKHMNIKEKLKMLKNSLKLHRGELNPWLKTLK